MDRNRITVVGLGFVGLPLSLSFAMKGHPVIGLDVSRGLIEDLNQGVTYHQEQYQGRSIRAILRDCLADGTFRATSSYREAFAQSGTFIVTVGLPIQDGMPVYDHFRQAMTDLGKGLKEGDLVLVRSTVVPGATAEIARPILESESGIVAGRDFHLAYASERIAEGKAFDEFENMPTVVAGISPESAHKARELLRLISKAEVHIASDMKVVEAAKVFENVSRDVNIALANQFAGFCQALGIDTIETFRMANTHKRVNLLTPGPGVGGYCLPSAYYYLRPKELQLDVDLSLLQMARAINDRVPSTIAEATGALLERQGKAMERAVVGVLGLAMKDYSNDDRNSPAHMVCDHLLAKGATVRAYDPSVEHGTSYTVDALDQAVSGADVLVILARQKAFDGLTLSVIKEKMAPNPVLVDTKHVFDRKEAESLGFAYFAI